MKRSSVVERELRSNNQSMDIDLDSVPNQIGTAVLSTVDGKILQSTGAFCDDDGSVVCRNIYRMLLDSAKCLEDEPLRRLSISFTDYNYVVTLGKKNLYIVKTEVI